MRYRSHVYDSSRWEGFAFRADDVVISTPAKCGTTWMQMLCALLIFDGPRFPGPLDAISPWLDMCNRPLDDVRRALEAQRHRRFIKTHTPLDGLPHDPRVTYLVVGRDPRDVAISFDHHRENMDFDHFMALRAAAVGVDDLADLPPRREPIADPVERFRAFIADDTPGGTSLGAVLHHLDTGWQRRHDANVTLFHYADMKTDLVGELTRLATALGIACSPERAQALAPEASLARMRERASEVAPSASEKNWKDTRQFFRKGALGEWRERLGPAELAAYDARVAALVPPDLATWVHHGRQSADPRTS